MRRPKHDDTDATRLNVQLFLSKGDTVTLFEGPLPRRGGYREIFTGPLSTPAEFPLEIEVVYAHASRSGHLKISSGGASLVHVAPVAQLFMTELVLPTGEKLLLELQPIP